LGQKYRCRIDIGKGDIDSPLVYMRWSYTLQAWESEWLIEFNPTKCEAITFSKKTDPIVYYARHYTHQGCSAKYFGVNICHRRSCNSHVDTIIKRATESLNFVRRNFSGCPRHIREHCYTSLVRPELEYAYLDLNKSIQSNIRKIESVQRSAAHFVCRDYKRTSSVTSLIQQLNWYSLQLPRARSKVLMIYRIRNCLLAIPSTDYLTPPACTTRPSFLMPSGYGIPYLPDCTSYHTTPSRISYPLSV